MINIVLAEDSASVRQSIAAMLEELTGARLTGTCECARDAIERIDRRPPDLAIIDLRLRESSGIEVLRHVRRAHPQTTVFVLTGCDSPDHRRHALEAGADRFFSKADELELLFEAIAQLAASGGCAPARRAPPGRFEIRAARDAQCYFALVSHDGKVLLTSASHVAREGVDADIATLIERIAGAGFERRTSVKRQRYFVLKAGDGRVIAKSAMHASTAALEAAILATRQTAPSAEIIAAVDASRITDPNPLDSKE